jgi:hypothetical protein
MKFGKVLNDIQLCKTFYSDLVKVSQTSIESLVNLSGLSISKNLILEGPLPLGLGLSYLTTNLAATQN